MGRCNLIPFWNGSKSELASCAGRVRSSINFRHDVAASRTSKWANMRNQFAALTSSLLMFAPLNN